LRHRPGCAMTFLRTVGSQYAGAHTGDREVTTAQCAGRMVYDDGIEFRRRRQSVDDEMGSPLVRGGSRLQRAHRRSGAHHARSSPIFLTPWRGAPPKRQIRGGDPTLPILRRTLDTLGSNMGRHLHSSVAAGRLRHLDVPGDRKPEGAVARKGGFREKTARRRLAERTTAAASEKESTINRSDRAALSGAEFVHHRTLWVCRMALRGDDSAGGG